MPFRLSDSGAGFLGEHILQVPPVVELTPNTRNARRVVRRRQFVGNGHGVTTSTITANPVVMPMP